MGPAGTRARGRGRQEIQCKDGDGRSYNARTGGIHELELEGGRPEGARGREAGKELEGGRLARRKIGGGGRKLKGRRPEGARARPASLSMEKKSILISRFRDLK
jgi:hypothetical protein